MTAFRSRAFRRLGRLAGPLLATGLALGIGPHGATAVERPDPPTLYAVEARSEQSVLPTVDRMRMGVPF